MLRPEALCLPAQFLSPLFLCKELPGVDFKALYRITYPPLSSDYYRSVKEAVEKSKIYDFVVVCPLGRVPYPELPAEIADFLIFKENIDFSLVIGFYGKDTILSIRSLRPDVNSAGLMQKIIKGYGRGGGHGVMAGGKISDVPFAKLRDFEKILTGRFLKALSLSSVKASPPSSSGKIMSIDSVQKRKITLT